MSYWKSQTLNEIDSQKLYPFDNSVLEFVDKVFLWAEKNYKQGQWIVETHTVQEVVNSFRTLKDVKEYCRLMNQKEQEVRSTIW